MDKRKSILIVDDEESNIYALQNYLECDGYKVFTEKNGDRALQFLNRGTRVDVILLDMMMPIMDGYETLLALKSDNRLRSIPVIAVTARAMKGDKEKCLGAGAEAYIAKPIILTDLIEAIEKFKDYGHR